MKRIIEWDLLTAEDIEVRVATTKNGKSTLLLYQDSRCAMRALDKQFGSFGWQMDYKVVGDQIYGTLSIYDEEKGIWVSKSDTGDKSNISEDKGQSSDILKRCAVRWGYAVELYTTPRIVVDDDGYGNTGYKVSEIEYDENRKITHLVLVNRFGKEVYRWNKNEISQPKYVSQLQQTNKNLDKYISQIQQTNKDLEWKDETKDNLTVLTEYCSQVVTDGSDRSEVGKFFRFYKEKCGTWRGKFDCEKLWNVWKQKAA